MTTRRGFLGAILAAAAAPAIARASSLMPIKAPEVWTPTSPLFTGEVGHVDGFRFIESTSDHLADALRYGLGLTNMTQDWKTSFERLSGHVQRVNRIEPCSIFVYQSVENDLRAAGAPVRRPR